LASLYDPLAMNPALLKLHSVLDRLVDKAFGAGKLLDSNEERLSILLEQYKKISGGS
jgi:hypothetical protein